MPARARLALGTLALAAPLAALVAPAARPAAAQTPRVTTPAYVLYAPDDSVAARARPELDSSAALARAFFGGDPAPIAVVVVAAAAELRAVDWAALRARGYQPLPWIVSPGGDVRRAGAGPDGVRTLGHEACHTFLLARYPRPAGAPPRPSYGSAVLPDWFDEAVAVRCEPAAQRADRLAAWRARLRADSAAALPLAELFRMEHPMFGAVQAMLARERLAGERPAGGAPAAGGDTARQSTPAARTPTVRTLRLPTSGPAAQLLGVDPERALAFYAQSLSVLHFLEAQEGPAFVGKLGDALAGGASMDDALAGLARRAPRDVAGLERAWRASLAAGGAARDG